MFVCFILLFSVLVQYVELTQVAALQPVKPSHTTACTVLTRGLSRIVFYRVVTCKEKTSSLKTYFGNAKVAWRCFQCHTTQNPYADTVTKQCLVNHPRIAPWWEFALVPSRQTDTTWTNVFAWIDGRLEEVCRPTYGQCAAYDGHHREHGSLYSYYFEFSAITGNIDLHTIEE